MDAKALTIRGVCQTCPDSQHQQQERALVGAPKKKRVSSSSSKSSLSSSKSTKSKPAKALPNKKQKQKKAKPVSTNDNSCDIYISKDGINVNPIGTENFGFLAGLALCDVASGTTVENLKFLCEADHPSPTALVPAPQPAPLQLGIGIYLMNGKSINVQNNEFINCHKGVILDGTQFTTVANNKFEVLAVDFPAAYGVLSGSPFDRWSSCNMVLILDRVLPAPSIPATTQTKFNVIEKNQGRMTSSITGGCAAFMITNSGSAPADGSDAIQYNFIRRNQVVGIGAAVGTPPAIGTISAPTWSIAPTYANNSLLGVYVFGSAQNNFIERNQFATLTADVFIDSAPVTGNSVQVYTFTVEQTLAHTIRLNRFIQTNGFASIVLGGAGHSVTENEISTTQTWSRGIFVLQGNDYIDANKITTPNTPLACDVQVSPNTIYTSVIENSGKIC